MPCIQLTGCRIEVRDQFGVTRPHSLTSMPCDMAHSRTPVVLSPLAGPSHPLRAGRREPPLTRCPSLGLSRAVAVRGVGTASVGIMLLPWHEVDILDVAINLNSRGCRLTGKAWQPITAALVVLGVPAAVGAEWRHLVARHTIAALALVAGWVAVCGAGVLVSRALSGPAARRLEQAGYAADRVAGWWLSGYDRRYRQWVLDSRRYIDVKDLATGGDHTPELDDVYVDVALVRRAPHQVSGNPLSGVAEDAGGRHSVNEFLDRRGRVVLAVVGPPGSGKSTLLAHAARRSARAGRRSRRRVPVLLALREYATTITAAPGAALPDVLRPAVRGVPGSEPDGWWERQLRRGKCMVLLDGLDEVAREGDRRTVAAWVERQISSYPDNHFVITSRPHGFPGPVISQADVLAVRPFTAEQVQLFLNRWYLAAERHATGATNKAQMRAVRIRAGESASRLLSLLQANPALHDLTANPLLLTMIATVHRYRGALPGSRADLYGEICQVMLSRRIQAKDLPELLPWPVKHKLLTALAYEMMIRRVSELPVRDVLGVLDPLLHRLPRSVTGPAFLEDISRNGLLVEPATGRYAFTHLTFQEYLAARHINANPGLAETLTAVVDDPWWRETLLLYAANGDADQVVRACLDSATIPALALAFDCAETSSELALELRRRLDQVRDHAYKHDCNPQHRRLIAAVLAARLTRQTVTTTAGTRICDRPVSSDLYWLFLEDSRSQQPDSPCDPSPDRPATGIRGSEAIAFLKWLNTITAGSMQAEFRLPDGDELHEQVVINALARRFTDSVTSLWIRPKLDGTTPELWFPPGQAHPHLVTGHAIRQAIMLDVSSTEILIQTLTVTAFSAALALARALASALALALALARHLDHDLDLALGRALAHALDHHHARDCDRALALALALDGSFALVLDRKGARDLAFDLDRILASARDLRLDLARDIARDIARTLGRAFDLAHALALARALDLDRARDIARALNVARAHAVDPDLDLDRNFDRDRILDRTLDLADDLSLDRAIVLARRLARDLDLDPSIDGEPRVRFYGISEIPLTWLSDGSLGRVTRKVAASNMPSSRARQTFADELTSSAGINGNAQILASLDGSLTEVLRSVRSPSSSGNHALPGWDTSAGANWLADASVQVLNGNEHPDAAEAAVIRALALALASDSDDGDDNTVNVFRAVAATITLLQQREQDKAKIGESITLALA
jgi:NACHT domain